MTVTEPRPYSSEWRDAEPQQITTRFGNLTIQPLGWGIRVETRIEQDGTLLINGGECRLSWADYRCVDGKWQLTSDKVGLRKLSNYGLDDATPKQREKLAGALDIIVPAWAEENAEEVGRREQAWLYDRARICEESIRDLELALAEMRNRLAQIERGAMDVSPYITEIGGKSR